MTWFSAQNLNNNGVKIFGLFCMLLVIILPDLERRNFNINVTSDGININVGSEEDEQ